LNNKFSKFETFGAITDSANRRKLAEAVFEHLSKQSTNGVSITNSESDNFGSAVNAIVANETMKNLCEDNTDLAEKVTLDILDFINKTKKEVYRTESPFEFENGILDNFVNKGKSDFLNEWRVVHPFISETYESQEIDLVFYQDQFINSLDETKNEDKSRPSFESVKEHFTEKWGKLLFKKQTKWELDLIELQRSKFCDQLYKQIEELKKLQEVLEPFTNELGRLWDISKGSWQRGNFDVLRRYAELLKNDSSLKELAEMLGRMRLSEKQFEEELFSSVLITPEWKAIHASKSDLIGIWESDDLSSLLPSETALLADDTMQSVFFKKFAEKKLQTFEYQAKVLSYSQEEFQDKRQKEKDEDKGPFIICVDTSGSMHGTPETVAKTLCFAILKIAIRENRKCFLISFSTTIQTLDLTDLKNAIDKIIDFLSMNFNGGTDASPAMDEALRVLNTAEYKKADVIVVSDFVMPAFDKKTQDLIIKAREKKTKFHSLVIGSSQNPATISDFDNNWVYDTNNSNSILTLVKNIYEI